jgi:multidrug efflux pump subunit AcrB
LHFEAVMLVANTIILLQQTSRAAIIPIVAIAVSLMAALRSLSLALAMARSAT